jgi:hypothetical protein
VGATGAGCSVDSHGAAVPDAREEQIHRAINFLHLLVFFSLLSFRFRANLLL